MADIREIRVIKPTKNNVKEKLRVAAIAVLVLIQMIRLILSLHRLDIITITFVNSLTWF